ncbi:PIN domain-containing protein [Candidatus Shapirobacteria bacterium]|nr:PIN domain-containing protein [Candidatus Shapirobacteria bacterium]
MIFVDTNYFLRFLLKDDNQQHQKAKDLFLKGADGKAKLFTSLLVIFEVYWVLTSFYQKQKNEAIRVLAKVLSLDFIKIQDKELLKQALALYQKTTLEFEDCYNLLLAKKEKIQDFKTFDRKLKRYFSLS